MATISLTIPAPVTNRVLDAISLKYGYTGFLANGTTVQTKADFVKAWMILQLKNAVKEQEANTAAALAFITATGDVETAIIIT